LNNVDWATTLLLVKANTTSAVSTPEIDLTKNMT
jgi:hypothetical protein